MKTLSKYTYWIIVILIMVGIFGITFNLIFGLNTISFIHQENINGFYLYKMDVWSYIENIRTNVTDVAELTLTTPTRAWQTPNIDNWWIAISNNLAVIVDYIIMIANVIIYPIRLGGYIVRTILTIIGIDFTQPNANMQWLKDLILNIVGLQIPYI